MMKKNSEEHIIEVVDDSKKHKSIFNVMGLGFAGIVPKFKHSTFKCDNGITHKICAITNKECPLLNLNLDIPHIFHRELVLLDFNSFECKTKIGKKINIIEIELG